MSVLRSELVAETAVITTVRVGLFYFCRKYLLRSLYHDLRVLSSQSLSSAAQPSTASTSSVGLEALSAHSPSTSILLPGKSPISELADVEGEDENGVLPSPSSTPRRKGKAFGWPSTFLYRRTSLSNAPTIIGMEGNFQSTLARTTFAMCFSESCVLFLILILQATGTLAARSRLVNWNISLTIIICLILLAIPLLQCLFITYRPSQSGASGFVSGQLGRRTVLTLVPYVMYLAAVSRIPVPEALVNADVITTSLSRLTVIGVLILGLISGYGCISTAFMFFADIVRSDSVEPSSLEIVQVEQSISRVRADLDDRRREVNQRQLLQQTSEPAGPSGGWLGRLPTLWRSGDPEATGLQREIIGLEMLEREMENNVNQLKMRKARIEFSRSWKGKLWKWVGWTFGAYCVFRILNSLINLILPRQVAADATTSGSRRTPDLITGLVIYLLSLIPLPPSLSFLHLTSPDQIAAISRQVSLVLVGCIVLVSVRGVLRGIGWSLRLMSGGNAVKRDQDGSSSGNGRSLMANFMLLVLAQVMGLYLLSTLIQLRNSFPLTLDQGEGNGNGEGVAVLFASLPSYEVFNALFDWAFLVSAGMTAIGRWIGKRTGLQR
ncbi:hypothetical protein FRB94_010952 [Tulasnella sp. JGI-2019a]|nr:hypothetical protein FRB94_010952 [Tulasnella sp. JGI-2019a]